KLTLRYYNAAAIIHLNTSILGGPPMVAELYRGGLFTIWEQIDNVVSARNPFALSGSLATAALRGMKGLL
ncbi:hypothetical protein HDU97_009149, partial [Phlyctochytrium planicorne]